MDECKNIVFSFNSSDEKSFAVIGRPIIEGDPVQNIKKIIESSN